MAELRGAVFPDRDGALVHDPGYLHDPAEVRLLPGVAEGLAAARTMGVPIVADFPLAASHILAPTR